MRSTSYNKLLNLSFPTDLIEKIENNDHNITSLKNNSDDFLLKFYSEVELKIIRDKLTRKPISDTILQNLISKSKNSCCFCNDGNSLQPYQIHHITPYHIDQNNNEDNLLLVCPTHHVTIHSNNYSKDFQLRTKYQWESLIKVVNEYEHKNIQFPFGTFEAISFIGNSDITEILNIKPLSSVVSRDILFQDIELKCKRILNDHHLLLLIGVSGSGKSTLALGLSGKYEVLGYQIYRYIMPYNKDNRFALREIAKFNSVSINKTLLIIDDANTLFNSNDIETLNTYVNSNFKIIVTWTQNINDSDAYIHNHVLNSKFVITFEDYKDNLAALIQR